MLCVENGKRLWIELVLQTARKYRSQETGFLHICHETVEHHQQTIPLLENSYYILALLRSRLQEDIAEAKALLSRILAFEVKGDFPIYMHQFPECRSRSLAIDLVTIFTIITKQFQHVLGEELRISMHCMLQRCIESLDRKHEEHPFPAILWMKRLSIDSFFSIAPFVPSSSHDLGCVFTAMESSLECREEDIAWMSSYWHSSLGVYCGPQGKECTLGGEIAPTLFDFFMSKWQGEVYPRLFKEHPLLLGASLADSFVTPFPEEEKEVPYVIVQETAPVFTLLWGTKQKVHSLVAEAGKSITEAKRVGSDIEVLFTLPVTVELAEIETKLFGFYLNYNEAHNLTVEGKKATVFKEKEELLLSTEGREICTISFASDSEGCVCMGHISRGNRPRQIKVEGGSKWEAYDLFLSLRVIRRMADCSIICRIRLKN